MTNYNEIADKIYDILCNGEENDEKRVLEYIAQELQNEGIGWIPVSERLPDHYISVLLFDSSNDVVITGSLNLFAEQWTSEDHDYFHGDKFDYITHWQPLPSGPKEAT